jgi:hypothetical protein
MCGSDCGGHHCRFRVAGLNAVAALVAAGVSAADGAALPALTPAIRNLSGTGRAGTSFRVDGIEPGTFSLWPAAWITGSAVGLLLLGAGIVQRRRFAARSVGLGDPLVRITANSPATKGWIELRRSLDDLMPIAGHLRPKILFPELRGSMAEARKRVVIAHELAHETFDYLLQSVAQIACAIYWFNPLFWMACRHLGNEKVVRMRRRRCQSWRRSSGICIASVGDRPRSTRSNRGWAPCWQWRGAAALKTICGSTQVEDKSKRARHAEECLCGSSPCVLFPRSPRCAFRCRTVCR